MVIILQSGNADKFDSIHSDDVEVLRHSLEYVQNMLAGEQERNKSAESRAVAILSVLGILAALTAPLASMIGSVLESSQWLQISIIGFAVLFLIKGLYQVFDILKIRKPERLVPESVYDYQSWSLKEVLRDDIRAHMGSHATLKESANKKVWRLGRAQRSAAVAISLYTLYAAFLLVARLDLGIPWPMLCCGVFTVVASCALLFLDCIAESSCFRFWRRP